MEFGPILIMKKSTLQKNKENEGFALLIAVMVVAVLISVTYAMFNISLKQVALSVAGKNSQIALFAADTGLECALYADYKVENAFDYASTTYLAGITTVQILPPTDGNPSFYCNGQPVFWNQHSATSTVTISNTVSDPAAVVSEFTFFHTPVDTSTGDECTIVEVTKYNDYDLTTNHVKTRVESKGYNICPLDSSGNPTDTSNPLRVERGLEVYY